MSNHKKLENAFVSILEIDATSINDDLKYQSIPEWDSINHMFLITELENVFDIEIDSEDIIEIKSFADAKTILTKYGVAF
ncbi:acyl carrier protein [Tamlana agarivorans]|uniref:Acyl carrier protein n=1 Tax=Pseudotamlana agarivorans TaxID=481183 RepID=A0ACC5UCD8_9FLAO|nr:acyl carrier protein [Tamlana agarivorans]MBU2951992.1 acyl carrier protein [Tamlana agarivorans]